MRELQREYTTKFIGERPDFDITPHRAIERAREELMEELYPTLPLDGEQMNLWEYAALAEEFADVVCFLFQAANHVGIDVTHAVRAKMDRNYDRFPVGMSYAEAKAREGKPIVEQVIFEATQNSFDY